MRLYFLAMSSLPCLLIWAHTSLISTALSALDGASMLWPGISALKDTFEHWIAQRAEEEAAEAAAVATPGDWVRTCLPAPLLATPARGEVAALTALRSLAVDAGIPLLSVYQLSLTPPATSAANATLDDASEACYHVTLFNQEAPAEEIPPAAWLRQLFDANARFTSSSQSLQTLIFEDPPQAGGLPPPLHASSIFNLALSLAPSDPRPQSCA